MKNLVRCEDCDTDLKSLREYLYKIKSEIWLTVARSDENLCIGCLEKRLKRKLTPNDFTDQSINRPSQYRKSARLLNRLSKQIHKADLMKGRTQ